MTIVNEPSSPILPVEVGFWWNENGPTLTATYDGDDYPYTSPEPASRYLMKTTLVNNPVEFFAILSKKQEEEKVKHPHIVTPPGVTILEYFWEFGDGTEGYGPFVTHTYKILDPEIEVKLTVVDSRNIRWSAAKPLNLYPVAIGYLAPFKIR